MFYSNKDSYIDINQLIQSLVIFEYNKIEWINRRGSEQILILFHNFHNPKKQTARNKENGQKGLWGQVWEEWPRYPVR